MDTVCVLYIDHTPVFGHGSLRVRDELWAVLQPVIGFLSLGIWDLLRSVLIPILRFLRIGV